jgi:hypothetical protein
VESGKKKSERIALPVLYSETGKCTKLFCPDAYHETKGFLVEVEAGSAVDGGNFALAFIKALAIPKVDYLCIAVRQRYNRKKDYEIVKAIIEAVYANRVTSPLKGILVVGY